MANTFLGYEIASPERQRKTALAIVGVVCAVALGGILTLFLVAQGRHSGREQAVATIAAFETKCRYVVRNLGRRVSYYDHTGLIDCDRAHEVARANDSVLGSVQRVTVAVVDFTAISGMIALDSGPTTPPDGSTSQRPVAVPTTASAARSLTPTAAPASRPNASCLPRGTKPADTCAMHA